MLEMQIAPLIPRTPAKQTTVNYKALYDHLLAACVTYFGVDVEGDELLTSYEQISKHMLNTADKVKVD